MLLNYTQRVPPQGKPKKSLKLSPNYTIVVILLPTGAPLAPVVLFIGFLNFNITTVAYCECPEDLPFVIEFNYLDLTENLKLAQDTHINYSGVYENAWKQGQYRKSIYFY